MPHPPHWILSRLWFALGLLACWPIHAAAAPATGPAAARAPMMATATPGYLGIRVVPLPPAVSAQMPRQYCHQGVLVVGVAPGSPAERAGLQPFDVLLHYEQQRILDPRQLQALLRRGHAGDRVQLQRLRHARVKTLDIVLAARPLPAWRGLPPPAGPAWNRPGAAWPP